MLYQNTLRIAVCDDLPEDRACVTELLGRYLDEKDILAGIDTFESGEAFLESDTSRYLLVFMDIYMKEKNGLDTVELLHKVNPRAQVVFNSTSRDHAVEAYQLEALNYLLKPISQDSFYKVMDRFFEYYSGVRTIPVKVGRAKEDVYVDDLIWAEADGKHAVLHMRTGSTMVSNSVAELQELLPASEFFRPIRWALISLKQMKNMNMEQILMNDGAEIPISRTEREAAKLAYADYRWRQMRQRT